MIMRCFITYKLLLILFVTALTATEGRAQQASRGGSSRVSNPGTLLDRVGFDQKLGAQISLDIPLRDEQGRTVRLGEYFGKRPVVLTLVYYRCPMLCGQELLGLTRTMRALEASAGKEFEVVTVSFDPDETPDLAAAKKRSFVEMYDRPDAERGWHFLTGPSESIQALTNSVGFRFDAIPGARQFAHAAGLVILSSDGRITRYHFGIEYPPKELRKSLDFAAAGRVASPIAKLLMLCYDYDPATGKYTLAVIRVLQVLGTGTALLLLSFVGRMWWRDRERMRSSGSIQPGHGLERADTPIMDDAPTIADGVERGA